MARTIWFANNSLVPSVRYQSHDGRGLEFQVELVVGCDPQLEDQLFGC